MDADFSAIQKDDIQWNGHVGTVQYGGDRSMVVMFYNKAVHNPAKSAETGRPFFEDVVFVRIHPPGERLNIIDRKANDQDRKRWPMQWAQFRENRQQIPEGTPIDLLYPDHPSIAQTLRAFGVHTVETCAELSATAIETIGMGSQRYVNDAQRYLQNANKGIGMAQYRRELDERDRKINTLEHQISLLMGEIEKLREVAQSRVDVGSVQAALAGLQGRPQFPAGARNVAREFDAATAQINATHPTREVASTKRKAAKVTKAKQPEPEPQPMRRRARIKN